MPLESATWVNQLDQTRPTSTDVKSEGDDVMRLIKSTLKNSLPNIGGAMTATHTELNRLVGATEDVQPRLSATLSAPNGETLNRLPAAASRQGGFLTFNASTGQPEVSFSLATASGNSLGIFSVSNVTTFFTNGTERMRIDPVGNVGIGVVPVERLHLSAAAGPKIRFSDSLNSVSIGSIPTAGDSSIGFYTQGATNERMRIDSAGNVGIGAVSSGERLHVSGNLTLVRGAGATIRLADSNNEVRIASIPTAGDSALGFYTQSGSNERMRIDPAGNVISNVNTTAPALSTNQQMVFALTSNTNLRISVRGTDGTTRVANLTLA